MLMTTYLNKNICDHSLWFLLFLKDDLDKAQARRDEASKHPKFNDKKKPLFIPPPNPAYIELKNAVEEEIRKRNNA